MLSIRHLRKVVPGMFVAFLFVSPAALRADECPEGPLPSDAGVQLNSSPSRVTIGDVKRARYEVTSATGAWPTNSYDLAYVMKNGKASVITDPLVCESLGLTSPNTPNRVQDYLDMGPILGIVGARREFVVGQTYDSVMLRPEDRPHFRYTCDRMETIAGISGYHVVVQSVRYGNTEAEFVLSPSFPFPLYVREHTGDNAIQITLMHMAPLDVAMGN